MVGSPTDYMPIAEHGVIGDLHSVALVRTDATIDWYCCPRFDSPSVFGAILDNDRGGYYRIAPARGGWTAKQLYLPDTNVLITRFLTPGGVGEVQDFMPIGRPGRGARRHRLFRRVVAVRGEMTFRLEVEPRFDYARASHQVLLYENGVVFRSPSISLTIESATPLRDRQTGADAEFTLGTGESATFVMEEVPETHVPRQSSEAEMREALEDTVEYWRRWLAQSRYEGRWREMVDRSALTLKLLTYRPTGAMVAAATTSLPEQIGGPRNWDYRYTWIRDAAFSVHALLRLGFTEEAAAFMDWLNGRLRERRSPHAGPLRVLYDIHGGSDLDEHILDHFEGYRGSTPVRIGNGAASQLQLDMYGEVIDSIYMYTDRGTRIHYDAWEDLTRLIDWISEHWDHADEGMWEVRSGRQHFTASKLMCWVALERGLRMALGRGLPANLDRWRGARDQICRQLMSRGYHSGKQAFVQHYDSDVLDAAILLMPLVEFLDPKDPLWLGTLDLVSEQLVSDGLVYRYNTAASPDGLEGEEGTFSICTFWYVEALARAGRLGEARLAFDKMLTYANHVGLYSEQIGLTGELLGNFPQALTHLGLISAAFHLDKELRSR